MMRSKRYGADFFVLCITIILTLSSHCSCTNEYELEKESFQYEVRSINGRDIKLINGIHSRRNLQRNVEELEKLRESADIIVIGAGFSGLGAARALQNVGENVIVLEAKDSPGGRARTIQGGKIPYDTGAMWLDGKNDYQIIPAFQNPINQLTKKFKVTTTPFADKAPHGLYKGGTGYDAISEEEFETTRTRDFAAKFTLQLSKLRRLAGEDASVSDGAREFVKLNEYSGQDEDLAIFQVEQGLTENWYAAPSDNISLKYFFEGSGFLGGSHVFNGGYGQLIDGLINGYGEEGGASLDVRLSDQVISVEYDGVSVTVITNTTIYTGSKAIITVPLGVLKAESIKFSPALPHTKLDAINKLEMGVLEKVTMVFENKFWSGEGVMYVSFDDTDIPYFDSFDEIYEHPTLIAWYGGNRATEISNSYTDDEMLVLKCLEELSEVFETEIPTPLETYVSHWQEDEYSFGSYAYIPVGGAKPEDMDILAEEVKNVYFAGEATTPDYYGQTYGALLSGIREARKINKRACLLKVRKRIKENLYLYISRTTRLFSP